MSAHDDRKANPAAAARSLAIQGLILAVIVGHGVCILAKREFWPWSDYPMYSRITPPQATSIRILGLTEHGEIEIPADPCLRPMGRRRVSATFTQLDQKHVDLGPPLRSMLALYRRNKSQGRHDGPDLIGLKLERRVWDLDPTLANLETPRTREVLAEIREPGEAQP